MPHIRRLTLNAALVPVFAAASMLPPEGACAQDTTAAAIAPVRVTVTRDEARSTLDLPFAVTRLTIDSARLGIRRASLTEMLLLVPDVVVSNRFNPSQDPRLAVRGFGARSAFGIRGVRILRDGIPLTQADGQTAVDYLDIESVGAVEVLRGSAGALYGNASGGVVDFRTEAPPDSGFEASAHGFYAGENKRVSARMASRVGPLGAQLIVTQNQGDGSRQYSDYRNTSGLGDFRWTLAGTRFQAQAERYVSPLALNPGQLTHAELDSDRTLADPAQIRKKSSKTVQQDLLTLQATKDVGRGSFTASLQDATRGLDNPQSFALVAVGRHTFGGSASARYDVRRETSGWQMRLSAGADFLNQTDERDNWTNCAGITGTRPSTCPGTTDLGSVTVDQRERVAGSGAYIRAEFDPVARLAVTATVRDDQTRFSVRNHLTPTAADQSRSMNATTPMVGINWRVGALSSLYANVSSSFETPTTTELANKPDGSSGLNSDLRPQHGQTWEAGTKGFLGGHLSYDAAIFRVLTTDELIPFEVPNGAGRRYYRNAGRTVRRGAEASVSATEGIASLGVSGSWLRYTYDDFVVNDTSYSGNRVPGVAPIVWSWYASVRPRWGLVSADMQHVGRMAANDPNLSYADAYTLVNARAAFDVGRRFGAEPVIGIDNLFDRTYAANVVTNAAAGRFFEPGAGRTFYIAARVTGGR